ncbi:MAG: DNA alkylation repair protein [Synergistaceae bacterium]|nr:DNA alkylation repair protein [Synergistaceae bacterium]
MSVEPVLEELRKELAAHADEETRRSGRRFFKEPVNLYGIKTAVGTKIAKEFFKQLKGRTKEEIFSLCEELWKSGMMEESFVACNWSYALRKEFAEEDFLLFERWIQRYVGNWASCDTLCNHTIGAFIETFPQYVDRLKEWTASENRWVRRASAVSLIIPARNGLFLDDVFEIAERLLLDADDLVRKGYGWLLKVTYAKHEDAVFSYILSSKDVMPRTALRYAIEKMPPERKKEAMKR